MDCGFGGLPARFDMQFDSTILPDRPAPALLGNGEMATVVGRSGYHDPEGEFAAQEFVLAGRRMAGPHHNLISFGRLRRTLLIGGNSSSPQESQQTIDTELAEVKTRITYEGALETTRTAILKHRNTFIAETRIINPSSADVEVEFAFVFEPGEILRLVRGKEEFTWEAVDNLGAVNLSGPAPWKLTETEATCATKKTLGPGEAMVLRVSVSFSDRLSFQEPVLISQFEDELQIHQDAWREFWDASEITTGDDEVDSFRIISLYTLACQATPWTIPARLAKPFWDGGAFHDEYYPFVALLSGGWPRIAKRTPYYRLATLPEARKRARGPGALYPWSATEDGKERDPHGHWYTERFHLGQIGACVWTYWLYERSPEDLEEMYPVLRECARYFEANMLERDERGALRTCACTDFDESVGNVCAGPFTMAAAAFLLDRACEAGRRLGQDREQCARFGVCANQLQTNLPVDLDSRRYVVPGKNPQHVSIIGCIVPFMIDEGSEFGSNSARYIHESCKTEFGWKPGLHNGFDGTAWMWTAGHLGMAHAVLRNGKLAWDAVRNGPKSAGQFMSPNEHLNAKGEAVIPWFTTGCGAWLSALHWMFARADDTGDHVLSAISADMQDFQFRGLRLSHGISVAAKVSAGRLTYFSLTSANARAFTFEIPIRFAEGAWPMGTSRIVDLGDTWRIQVELIPGENVFVGE